MFDGEEDEGDPLIWLPSHVSSRRKPHTHPCRTRFMAWFHKASTRARGGERLAEQAKGSSILLANPPFQNFTSKEQQAYRDGNSEVRFLNKSAEMLWRTLPQLPEGGIFGIVVPQTILHSDNARDIREFLVVDCELKRDLAFPRQGFPILGCGVGRTYWPPQESRQPKPRSL